MTRKEQNAAHRADFQRRCLEYRIRCARRTLPLAPLPEFRAAIENLECFRDGIIDRGKLAKIYRRLSAGRKRKEAFYGYTALGEIYRGLLGILYSTLHPRNEIWSCDCQRFVEARFLAAETVTPPSHYGCDWAFKVMHAEYDYQEQEHKRIFGIPAGA